MDTVPDRLQLRLSGPAKQLLAEMCDKLGTDPKNVILDALAVYHFALGEVEKGHQFGGFDPRATKFTAIVTPTLQKLGRKERVLAL